MLTALSKGVCLAPAGRDKVELLMCLGANRWEATRSLRQRCLTAALTQQLNQMGTMGLVTIPGVASVRSCAGLPRHEGVRITLCSSHA